jgi:amino acid transporter
MKKTSKLSTWQLMLISTGGMIGAGWLFSPYYGFQTAGIGVLLSWAIVTLITLIIGISFAEVITIAPIVGGLSRFIGITHNRTISFVFLALGWLSFVVYLPIEAQSAIQYLSFWFGDLVTQSDRGTILSRQGLAVGLLIIILLTWFNSFLLKNVAKVNSVISIWKILIPLAIAWFLILSFGEWKNVDFIREQQNFSFEKVLLAITGSGMAFAFTGFQNGLILANSAKDPKRAMPYSLFSPIIVGFLLYSSLSLIFITCLGDKQMPSGSAAPLLGIVSLFGIHVIINILFIDAVIAPLGTASVYTAVTARILFGLGKVFFPKSSLNKLNKFSAPVVCLWINAVVGSLFLLPLPTWQELVDFLSSVVVFSYLAGPISLIILREDFPSLPRPFKVWNYQIIGYAGFVCCSLLIYWSSLNNLIYLAVFSVILIAVYGFFIDKTKNSKILTNFFITAYLATLAAIKFSHKNQLIEFPFDNLLVIFSSIIFCKIFLAQRISKKEIEANLEKISHEKNE